MAKGNKTQNGMVKIKSEGERISKGDQIFRYKSENEDELNSKINELNQKIQEAVQGNTNLFPRDIQAIDEQIDNKIDGLKSKNNFQEISEYKKDINTYITKKAEISGDLSNAGTYINNLIKERESYQKKLTEGSEYVTAPMSGVVSYRVDGLEESLTIDSLDKIDRKFLKELDIETGQIISTSTEQGKIINNYECYIATIVESDNAKEAKVNDKVTLRLSTQDEITGTIEQLKEQDDKSILIIFKINDCVEKLIDYRKISFDIIWWKYEGLKVPKGAIIYDNGLSYVVRNRAGYQDKILVKVLKENDNFCIVTNYDNEELKNLGYTTNEIRTMKKISIYDEIILNPSMQ